MGQLAGSFDAMASQLERREQERAAAERELAASEEKFRSIVESSPTAMFFCQLTPDGRLVLTGVNPAAEKLMGIPLAPFLGKSLEEVFPGLVGTAFPGLYRQVAQGEAGPQSFQVSYQDERINGAPRGARLSDRPVRHYRGHPGCHRAGPSPGDDAPVGEDGLGGGAGGGHGP